MNFGIGILEYIEIYCNIFYDCHSGQTRLQKVKKSFQKYILLLLFKSEATVGNFKSRGM